MSRVRTIEAALWMVAVAAGLGTLLGLHAAAPVEAVSGTRVEEAPAPPRAWPDSLLRASADFLVEHDPFRLDRRPADVAYGEAPRGGGPVPGKPPPPPRAALAVSGILGGPPWQALIEGIPGREGSVLVRQGEELGELRVHYIGPDSVVVAGTDTTWHLSLERPWS